MNRETGTPGGDAEDIRPSDPAGDADAGVGASDSRTGASDSPTGASNTVLQLDSVARIFDAGPVFADVSIEVHAGETLAVIGPSGVGKTTLLRTLGLFDRPDRGTVRVDGTIVSDLPERDRLAARRRVGTVFQEANLFDASVRRNVAYGIHVRRRWTDRIRATAARVLRDDPSTAVLDALETVGMATDADREAGSLSGGEAQRVAFARATAYDPDVLLLDEPTSDLDPRNTAVIEEAVRTARNRGMGVALATHDMHQARRLADRVAVMLDASIIEVGETERVFSDPRDPRTRKFIDGDLVY